MISARRRCNLITHPDRSSVFKGASFAACLVFLMGLSACTDQAPTSTLDGLFTSEQAARGASLFDTHCVRCHSIREFSGPAFNTLWRGTPLAALYVRIANTMPLDQPGSLGTVEATALTAHILQQNNMPSGSELLVGDVEWMATITID